MAKAKKIRLFRVSRELNLAKDTLIEHLQDNGFTLEDVGPNAILSEDMYAELLHAFAKDREAASRHEERVRVIRSRQEESSRADEVTLEDVMVLPDEEPPELEPEPEPVPVEEPVAEAPPPVEEVVEAPAEDVEVPEPVVEESPIVEAEPVAEAPEEVIEEPAVVEEEPVAEAEPAPVVEAPEEEAVAEEIVEAEAVEEEAEAPEAEAVSTEDETEEDEETLTADRYTLEGPKVVGKVDLDKMKEAIAGDQRTRKRRRRRKKADPAVMAPKEDKSAGDAPPTKKKRRKKGPKVDQAEVEKALQETKQKMAQGATARRERSRQRRRARREERAMERQLEEERVENQNMVLEVMEFVSANELANLMNVSVTDIISTCLELGMMISINQRLDADTISLLADEFGYEVEFITEVGISDIEVEEDAEEDLQPRSPVVTVMGHVDHGKTSVLDYIRRTNVVAGEAGGITQHIGAYEVQLPDGREITFLDTPGHEAFTAMRARGAQVTDVVIVVVAADDAVMPQTIEAINHSRAAEVPIIVAVNKMDKPSADPQRVMQQLSEHNILVEQWGGQVQCALVSAKSGEGISDLLEKVLLEAEVLELTANPDRNAVGTVIESRLDKGRGVVSTVLVQKGTLSVGDVFVAGSFSGRVRAMFDERDHRIVEAGPSAPALVLGFDGQPDVGDVLVSMDDEREARNIAQHRQQIQREQNLRQRKHITLDEIGRRLALGDFQELNLIVKADVGGSVEALMDALLKLSTEEVQVRIIHSGVGAITEGDVLLASASDAVIIGFQVRPMIGARRVAEREEIDVRTYAVIYDAIEDVRDALEGMLSPELSEKVTAVVEIRELFKVPKIGTVAGCYVSEGKIRRNDKIRLIREGVVIYEGTLASLKRFKDDVREVASGYECGLSIVNYNDIKVGDQVEAYEIIASRRQLEV